MHKEDVDVCWRAQLRGWKSLYVPQAQAHHIRTFRPGQRKQVDPYLKMCAVRNRYLLMLKNDITRLFWRDFLHIAFYDLMIIGFVLLREQRSLKGFYSAWQLRGRMLDKRRHIQSQRNVSADEMSLWFRAGN
jgi:GT2 family glycosyltransferase